MELLIGILVISLLEQDVGADASLVEFAVVFHRGGGDVDVDTADGAILVFDRVDRMDGVEDILDRVVDRVFTGFDGQALMAHILQGDDFVADLFLRKLYARDGFVDPVIGAVDAAVYAVVGQIKRGEQHDAVAVELLFDVLGKLEDLLIFFGDLTGQ